MIGEMRKIDFAGSKRILTSKIIFFKIARYMANNIDCIKLSNCIRNIFKSMKTSNFRPFTNP